MAAMGPPGRYTFQTNASELAAFHRPLHVRAFFQAFGAGHVEDPADPGPYLIDAAVHLFAIQGRAPAVVETPHARTGPVFLNVAGGHAGIVEQQDFLAAAPGLTALAGHGRGGKIVQGDVAHVRSVPPSTAQRFPADGWSSYHARPRWL